MFKGNTLIIVFLTFVCLGMCLQNLCSSEISEYKSLDISAAAIQHSPTYQYDLELLDTAVDIVKNDSGIVIFTGNFSRLTLKHPSTKHQTIYIGRQITFKMPAFHHFFPSQIPDLEIQILHYPLIEQNQMKNKPSRFDKVLLSQLFGSSPFKNRIEVQIGKYFNKDMQNGDIIQTGKIFKLLPNFPMLMYKGTVETYPCDPELLCLVRKEYPLIGEDDLKAIKIFIGTQPSQIHLENNKHKENQPKNTKRKPLTKKKIYQINQVQKKEEL